MSHHRKCEILTLASSELAKHCCWCCFQACLSVCVCVSEKLQVINWCHVVRLCAVTKKLELIRFWWPWPLTLTTIFTFHASVTDRYWWHSVIGLFAYLCRPLLTQNISQTMTDARLDPGALICRTHWLLIGTVRFHLGWPWGVKNQGHTFWCEICREWQQLRCWTQWDYGHKLNGDSDRHVGIYASPDNWRLCL